MGDLGEILIDTSPESDSAILAVLKEISKSVAQIAANQTATRQTAQDGATDRFKKRYSKEQKATYEAAHFKLCRKLIVVSWSQAQNHKDVLDILNVYRSNQWDIWAREILLRTGKYVRVELGEGRYKEKFVFLKDSRHCCYELIPADMSWLEKTYGPRGDAEDCFICKPRITEERERKAKIEAIPDRLKAAYRADNWGEEETLLQTPEGQAAWSKWDEEPERYMRYRIGSGFSKT